VASKRADDIKSKRNHLLQTCSGMYALCSGPNKRYRLPLGKDEAVRVQIEQNFKLTYV
jgi:hypothetical protein